MKQEITLDDVISQFGELFKEYLTNPIFRNNMNLLMQTSIQEKVTCLK